MSKLRLLDVYKVKPDFVAKHIADSSGCIDDVSRKILHRYNGAVLEGFEP